MSQVLDPALAELRAELERAGMVVVPHGDHICVRLPMFASVRARIEDGRLRFDPQLGPFRRARGVLVTALLGTAAGAGGFLALGPDTPAFAIAFGALGVMILDIARMVLTESAITRMQFVWSLTSRLAPRGGEAAPALAAPVGAIGAPGLQEVQRQTARADRA